MSGLNLNVDQLGVVTSTPVSKAMRKRIERERRKASLTLADHHKYRWEGEGVTDADH